MNLTDYTVVTQTDAASLVKEVQLLMAQGWQPLGSIAAAPENGVIRYIQAMGRTGKSVPATPPPQSTATPVPKAALPTAWEAFNTGRVEIPTWPQYKLEPIPQAQTQAVTQPVVASGPRKPSEISAQFIKIDDRRYTIFDAVDLPGRMVQISCTLAHGDKERLTRSGGKVVEFDERGQTIGRGSVVNVTIRGSMAILDIRRFA